MKGRRVTRRKKKGPARGSRDGGGFFNIFKRRKPVAASAPVPVAASVPVAVPVAVPVTSDMTPLMWAAWVGNMTNVKKLVEEDGAYINARNASGWTATMWAINGGHQEIVKYLTDNGAKISKSNVQKARDIANERKRREKEFNNKIKHNAEVNSNQPISPFRSRLVGMPVSIPITRETNMSGTPYGVPVSIPVSVPVAREINMSGTPYGVPVGGRKKYTRKHKKHHK
jgi:hypothetical protein